MDAKFEDVTPETVNVVSTIIGSFPVKSGMVTVGHFVGEVEGELLVHKSVQCADMLVVKVGLIDGTVEGEVEGIAEGDADGIVEGEVEGIVEGAVEGEVDGLYEVTGATVGDVIHAS